MIATSRFASVSVRPRQNPSQAFERHLSTQSRRMAPIRSPIAIIQGVGPGTGSSVARKFAQKYPVVLLSRNEGSYAPLVKEIESSGGTAIGISTDVTSPQSVHDAFEKIEALGEGSKVSVAAAVLNGAGSFTRKPFLELTVEDFDNAFYAAGRGAFLFCQAVLPLLLAAVPKPGAEGPSYPPTLIFTGATASIKGSANFATFASGKWSIRALAQSLAREFGPKGVHVAHAVIDGVIDIPRTAEWKFDAPDAKISPEAIADAYWHLATQPRTSFTHEIDIRPYVEKW